MIDQKLINEGLERWARTPDGALFYVGLQKVLMGVPSDSSDGALRENLGRRRFAAELMAVMAKALSESDPSVDPERRPVVFQLPEPVSVAGQRGAKRRVGPAAGTE